MFSYIFFVLDRHLASLWESNCPFGFLPVMFPLGSSYFVFVFLSLSCLIIAFPSIFSGGTATSHVPLAWQGQVRMAQFKGPEEDAGRRNDGMDNIKDRTWLRCTSSQRAVEDKSEWSGTISNLSALP